jgi:hypothetical protein
LVYATNSRHISFNEWEECVGMWPLPAEVENGDFCPIATKERQKSDLPKTL